MHVFQSTEAGLALGACGAEMLLAAIVRCSSPVGCFVSRAVRAIAETIIAKVRPPVMLLGFGVRRAPPAALVVANAVSVTWPFRAGVMFASSVAANCKSAPPLGVAEYGARLEGAQSLPWFEGTRRTTPMKSASAVAAAMALVY